MTAVLQRIAENALSAGIVVGSGVLNVSTPNRTMEALKVGVSQIVAEDIVRWVNSEGSLILNMDYRNFTDRVIFASGFVYALNMSGATSKAVELLDKVSPFGETIDNALLNGGLITLNRTVADIMDATAPFNQVPLVYLNHLSLILG